MKRLSEQMLKHESDRGCVLVGHAALDEALELLLKAAFSQNDDIVKTSIVPLFAANGPLTSFWAKTHLANSLGLLSPSVYSDLEIMRKIRNEFAHQQTTADFNDPTIVPRLKKLSTTEHYSQLMKGKRYKLIPDSSGKFTSPAQLQESGILKFHKTCFSWCVEITFTYFNITVTSLEKGGIAHGRAWAQKWETDKMWTQFPPLRE